MHTQLHLILMITSLIFICGGGVIFSKEIDPDVQQKLMALQTKVAHLESEIPDEQFVQDSPEILRELNNSIQKTSEEKTKIENELNELEDMVTKITGLQDAQESLQSNIDSFQEKINSIQERLKVRDASIKKLAELRSEMKAIQKNIAQRKMF